MHSITTLLLILAQSAQNLRPKATVLALIPSCDSMSHEPHLCALTLNVKLSLESFPGTTAY